ncbi:PHD finger protein 20-like [Notothenia coriiceps]|uniref:PHD finger protein 20-like n=1 Tax=Notothenia coriiceps TaxID=8208 RepID=A0A6I9PZK8_9TELE|nr:PREDICTED: PHD finger protein 20-like [Notothenia coriiceps]
MSKTPPNRRGISFEVGAQLEARDSLKNWYAANIEKVDFEGEKIQVHYRQWSHRYDEWFDWTSPYLRPVERVTLRRQGLQDDAPVPGFHVNDKVLASWSDCRFYPAKVLSVNKDASYTVKFYDGVIQTVKEIHVKPFIKERGGGKCRSSERTMVRRAPNRRRPQENGGPKNKRARRSTSDREEDSNSEQDEREQGMVNEKNKKTNGELSAAPAIKQEEEVTDLNAPRDLGKGAGLTNGVKEEKAEEQSKEKCLLNGEVKQEEMETKPYTESPKPNAEESPTAQMEQVPVSMTTTESKGGVEQKPSVQSEGSEPAADVPPPVPVKPVRKQGFHNPNRFSREPLYRVIKNQPPPVLSINLDHNPFKCSAPGCTKSFRKAKLLHYHMKYYHGEEQPLEGESSPTRSIQTRASEKQTAPLDGIKRRRTISASLHPVGPAPVARGEVKTAGRRTSAPPAVSTQIHQQRALLREKSKENHLDRNGCQQLDSDKSGFDIGSVKDKLKQKQKDFLTVKWRELEGNGKEEPDEEEVAAVAARLSFSRALDIKISPRLMSSSGVALLLRHESEAVHDLSRCFQGCRHSCKSGTFILICSPLRISTTWCTSPSSWWVVVIFLAFWLSCLMISPDRLQAALGGSWSQAETREEAGRDPGEAADNSRQHQQRQINLLDHIDAVQDEVSHRMDFIERELDVLESWLDYTGELEPPEPLARLPQLKHRMKRLLTQLGKVQQIALYSST